MKRTGATDMHVFKSKRQMSKELRVERKREERSQTIPDFGYLPAAFAIAGALSRAGWNGCKENGNIDDCPRIGCPCGNQAMRIVDPAQGGVSDA